MADLEQNVEQYPEDTSPVALLPAKEPRLVSFAKLFYIHLFNPFMMGVFYGAGYLLGQAIYKWLKAKIKEHF